jgi:hypothetical protein
MYCAYEQLSVLCDLCVSYTKVFLKVVESLWLTRSLETHLYTYGCLA